MKSCYPHSNKLYHSNMKNHQLKLTDLQQKKWEKIKNKKNYKDINQYFEEKLELDFMKLI